MPVPRLDVAVVVVLNNVVTMDVVALVVVVDGSAFVIQRRLWLTIVTRLKTVVSEVVV